MQTVRSRNWRENKKMFIKTLKKRPCDKRSFFSCCLHFYENYIFKKTPLSYQKQKQSNTILNVLLQNGPIIVLDYSNIIYVLHDVYKSRLTVIRLFYSFLYTQICVNNAVIIVLSKNVIIKEDGVQYFITDVLKTGKKLTKKNIPNFYFEKHQLVIFQLDYPIKISSSVDDFLGYFFVVVIYAFLKSHNINPLEQMKLVSESSSSTSSFKFQKLNMITNDRQNFEKNLFGVTDMEELESISLFQIRTNSFFYDTSIDKKKDEFLLRTFLNTYITTKTEDIHHLSCFIRGIVKHFHSPSFLSKKTSFVLFSYRFFKKKLKEIIPTLCTRSLTKENEYYYYYLYVLIKSVQRQLFHNKLFGNFSKETIQSLF